MQHTPKLIMCDANLKDETINHFLTKREKTDEKEEQERKKRNTIRIQNTYRSFGTITTRFYFCKKIFINSTQTFVKKDITFLNKINLKMFEKFYNILLKFSMDDFCKGVLLSKCKWLYT